MVQNGVVKIAILHLLKKKLCNIEVSVRKDTFFSHSHLKLKDACRFIAMYLLVNFPKSATLQDEFQFATNTVTDWVSFIREVFVHWAWNNTSKIIGGPGKIVEIDEAKFGKRKYERGRIIEGQWVFGGIERGTNKMFMIAVKDRKRDTLIKVIKEKIAPQSMIMSDCWRAYDAIQHCTVNHSKNFVDPGTGAHTQNIERK